MKSSCELLMFIKCKVDFTAFVCDYDCHKLYKDKLSL